MKTLLFVFGTRPEAIKLAPLILKAKSQSQFRVLVCSTGQHREMLTPILDFFEIHPDFNLDVMRPGQTLSSLSQVVMSGVQEILDKNTVDAIVVQGDTTSCYISALVGFHNKVKVIHIEAGLRSGDVTSPYPEEFYRKSLGLFADLHMAPTQTAANNLILENICTSRVHITGNTGIDALREVKHRIANSDSVLHDQQKHFSFLNPQKKLILVTVHRRESFGDAMEQVMKGVLLLAQNPDYEIIFPMHLNPSVRESAKKVFQDSANWMTKNETSVSAGKNIWLCDPIDYIPFVYLMDRAYLIVTDSGGVQEEAPTLGKPIVVAREKTERTEALDAGTSILAPMNATGLAALCEKIMGCQDTYQRMSTAANPYGDGFASEKIVSVLADYFTQRT